MENSITFKEKESFRTQQTIAKVLRERKYFFIPITEYDNEHFYCMTKCVDETTFSAQLYRAFKWLGVKRRDKYINCPLSIVICGKYSTVSEPFVFNREDVLNIVSDIPENYVGENML